MRSSASVSEVVAALNASAGARLRSLVHEYSEDPRPGVRSAVHRAERRLQAADAERLRLDRLYAMERQLRAQGLTAIAGVDEVGRGALAGPLTVAACVLPSRPRVIDLDDSKRLTPARRQQVAERVREVAVAVTVVHLPPAELDVLGMTAALRRTMLEALESLDVIVEHVLVDGLPQRLRPEETAVVGGDGKVAAIAAASVVAKVERDALMVDASSEHPAYGFEINKGYGTEEHVAAIRHFGVCPLHRRSFAPCMDDPRLF